MCGCPECQAYHVEGTQLESGVARSTGQAGGPTHCQNGSFPSGLLPVTSHTRRIARSTGQAGGPTHCQNGSFPSGLLPVTSRPDVQTPFLARASTPARRYHGGRFIPTLPWMLTHPPPPVHATLPGAHPGLAACTSSHCVTSRPTVSLGHPARPALRATDSSLHTPRQTV
jgi:hypothetical protein